MTISSFCNFGECVEVLLGPPGHVLVRDTKTGMHLTFTHEEWDTFLLGVYNGEFDLAVLS